MKLWIVSDLHLDLRNDFVAGEQRPTDFDVLVVAGDVVDGDVVRGIETVAVMADGRPAICVSGNHCHWGHSFRDVRERGMEAGARTGVHFLQNSTITIDGVTFFGATLWSPTFGDGVLPADEPLFVQGPGVMDRRAKNRDIVREFEASRAAMRTLGADVIVTHYPPAADLISEIGVPIWIHGHEHRVRDEIVVRTRVLANATSLPQNICSMVVDIDDPTPRLVFHR